MTGTAKTEEVEFEKTHKLETTIVPTNRVRARQDWADQVYKPKRPSGGPANETAEIHKNGGRCLWAPPPWRKASCRVRCSEQRFRTTSQCKAGERAGIGNRCLGAAPSGDHRHQYGRQHHIILGGNSDYMARLKLREVLLGRLVKPEDVHNPPLPSSAFRSRWFRDAATLFTASQRRASIPALTDDTDLVLGQLARDLVKAWGDRALTVIELEDASYC